MKWLAILMVAVLIASMFFPWVTIDSKNIVVTGLKSEGTNFGMPGVFNLFLCFVYLVLLLINKTWSKRTAFFVSAFNVAWAARNFIVISTCYGGVCPEKHAALYLLLFASILLSIFSLFFEVRPKPAPAPDTNENS